MARCQGVLGGGKYRYRNVAFRFGFPICGAPFPLALVGREMGWGALAACESLGAGPPARKFGGRPNWGPPAVAAELHMFSLGNGLA